MPMTPESYHVFWQDMRRAVPERFALVHYNTPRVHNYQLRTRLCRAGPGGAEPDRHQARRVNVTEFMTLMACAPELSHFTGEHAMTPYTLFGARGVYSWFANFNAAYMVAWYEDLTRQRWEQARHRQERMHALILAADLLRGPGNLHGIVGKALSSASPFLVVGNHTRRPYSPIPSNRCGSFAASLRTSFQTCSGRDRSRRSMSWRSCSWWHEWPEGKHLWLSVAPRIPGLPRGSTGYALPSWAPI